MAIEMLYCTIVAVPVSEEYQLLERRAGARAGRPGDSLVFVLDWDLTSRRRGV